MRPTIHIGEEIRKLLKEQQRSITWLADEINCDQSNLSKQLKNKDLCADQIYSISIALGRDLFALYSQLLSKVTPSEEKTR